MQATQARPDLPAVILAGGQGRRMGGQDKALVPLAGATLLAHVVARLAPQCGQLAVNANGDAARFAAFGLPVLGDPVAGHPGPLAGILAAMIWAKGLGHDAVICVSVDTPFLPTDLVAGLWAARGASGLAVASSGDGRVHPTCAVWPVALRPALEAALKAGALRLGDLTQAQGAGIAVFAADPDPFFNINHPADLALAEQRLHSAQGAR